MNAIAQTVTLSTALVASLGHQVPQVSWAPDLDGYVGVCTTCGHVLTVSLYGNQWVFSGTAKACKPQTRRALLRKAAWRKYDSPEEAAAAKQAHDREAGIRRRAYKRRRQQATTPPVVSIPRRLSAEVYMRPGSIAYALVGTVQTGR